MARSYRFTLSSTQMLPNSSAMVNTSLSWVSESPTGGIHSNRAPFYDALSGPNPAGGNKRRNGLLYRLKTGESRAVSKTLAALLDGNAGTAHDMSPGGFGVTFLQTELPLIEGREGESGFPAEPAVHCFGIAPQGERLR